MTQNVVDLDAAARIYGTCSERMAIPILAFWDFGSAFPSLAHAWVFTVLAAMKLPLEFIALVTALYGNSSTVTIGEKGTELLFFVTSGVLQGCPLSGMLFVWAMVVGPRCAG